MTPFFSRGMSGIAQCCAILALTNRKPIEEKEKPMKRYIVERTVNDEPTGINWEFDTREEALAFFKQAAEDREAVQLHSSHRHLGLRVVSLPRWGPRRLGGVGHA